MIVNCHFLITLCFCKQFQGCFLFLIDTLKTCQIYYIEQDLSCFLPLKIFMIYLLFLKPVIYYKIPGMWFIIYEYIVKINFL